MTRPQKRRGGGSGSAVGAKVQKNDRKAQAKHNRRQQARFLAQERNYDRADCYSRLSERTQSE